VRVCVFVCVCVRAHVHVWCVWGEAREGVLVLKLVRYFELCAHACGLSFTLNPFVNLQVSVQRTVYDMSSGAAFYGPGKYNRGTSATCL